MRDIGRRLFRRTGATCMRVAAGLMLLTLVPSCSSMLSEPIGIGPDRDELKQSPCACYEIRQSAWRRV